MEGVVTWRMLLTEKEPEVHSGMVVWSGGRSRVAVGLMRLIRPQFSNIMLPKQLHIIYKGKNYCKGLIEPDECSLLQLKIEVVKITSEDGLTTPEIPTICLRSSAICRASWVNESGNEPLSRRGGIHGPQTNLAGNVGCETDADEDESPSKSEGRDEPQIVRNENVQQNVDDNDDDDCLSDFDKEFAADGGRINHQNIAEDAEYGGVLLAAVSMDTNNGMVPLAIGVCEIENTETWIWFLEILYSYFDNGSDQITFCSDRQKGLLGAIGNTWPTAFHRPCARHIYSNFSKDHPGVTLRNLFCRAVSSTNKFDHAAAMEKLKKEKLEAWQWLERELAGFTWSRYEYDKNCKVDRTSNNTSECFNNWILPHRDKPCLTMLEEIRCMFMTLFTERRKEAQSWSNIPSRVKKELDEAYETGSKMTTMASGDLHF
ncbi:hypothetical protein WN943_000793 [Citrus x changshan-huyou]